MVRYGGASAAAVMILLVGLVPTGSGQGPQTPQAGAVVCAGAGGNITFVPPLTIALGTGTVQGNLSMTCIRVSIPGEPTTAFETVGFAGTYRGDCVEAQIAFADSTPSGWNVWGGRLLQANGALVIVPNFVFILNFVALLAPEDPCNQSATAIKATAGAGVMSCRPDPGSGPGCG